VIFSNAKMLDTALGPKIARLQTKINPPSFLLAESLAGERGTSRAGAAGIKDSAKRYIVIIQIV